MIPGGCEGPGRWNPTMNAGSGGARVGRQVRTSSRCGASERTALWMPVCCGTVCQIGLSPAWSERSRTSPSIAETTSAATSAGVICDRVVSTCTECSPKRSTVESNPAGEESHELVDRLVVRSMLRQMKPQRAGNHPLGPPHPGRLPRQVSRLISPSAGITPENTTFHNTRR